VFRGNVVRGSTAGVHVVARPERRGKACALDDAAALANHEVLVFCDTRQWIEPQALRMLVAPLCDPEVGGVSGTIALAGDGGAVGRGYGVYWRYETFLRRCESEIDSLLGATGALYAIRRELFESIPADTLDDDLAIPCHALRRGGRIVFEPRARAIDEAPTQAGHEFGRKVRTLAGCFQLFGRERWLFDPRKNPIWLQTMSHKGLRLLGPFCMIAAFVATLALADDLFYTTALVGQIMFYGAAVVGLAAPRFARRVLAVPSTFVLLQAAVVVGLVRLLTGRQPVTWKTSRPAPLGQLGNPRVSR
jgi:cellulose synthase/poly-beta-1,6-N-acetylglucosamine synthase-like glycosyltransferase